jgi:hypothetical protein
MDQDPLAVLADGDRDRLHRGEAVGRAVARVDVEVARPEAVRTVVSMSGSGSVRRNVEPTVDAPEGGRAFQGWDGLRVSVSRPSKDVTPGPGNTKTVLRGRSLVAAEPGRLRAAVPPEA